MTNKDNGGAAFARPASKTGPYSDSPKYHAQDGMTLRDYFAAKAMQAIISTVPHLATINQWDAAEEAYSYADAMLTERAK